MQLLRSGLLLALFAASPVATASSMTADDHPGKHAKHHSHGSLRRSETQTVESKPANEWQTQQGMLHLEAAEVETEAAEYIHDEEMLNFREEHAELAARDKVEKVKVEKWAARDWHAVANAAESEAVQLQQDLAGSPAGAPGPGPAPADFSWAHSMDASKPVPEQGFEGKAVLHMDKDTMNADWQNEHALDPQADICRICARHPGNMWCKQQGCITEEPSVADQLVEAAEGIAPEPKPQPPATQSKAEPQEKESGGLFDFGGEDDPLFGEKGLFGKKGAIAEAFKSIFGSGSQRASALAAVLPVMFVLSNQ